MLHKKSLGQHFLRDPHILEKIVSGGNLSSTDTVLEVGPGEGTLTELLLAQAGKVIAVEKDDRLIPLLKLRFAGEIAEGRLELIHEDILSFTPSDYKLKAKNYKLIANLPYYITGEFLRKFLQELDCQPSSMILLLQKEVARRIVAMEGRESILSISIKVYGEPHYRDTVKAGSFSPPPSIDSAILSIDHISKRFFETLSEKAFFDVLKKGFSHPRKLLSSNLGIEKDVLASCGIEEKARAETLKIDDWKNLAEHLSHS
ncbi:MAG: ribosomal RNA small subunit methyltransferase A [Candidatus Taylorbacteria bacterium CG11_big_fil_rev_8_21_14_0_20_46_11]|uniref:Ribosomal RNA small subunit methyltransferase A n=1 Tax=Candidatus Taylorbacteria bacterium CG11_big_fil_rev_8_21_14_0_20_46_11 TaxID=1975025 RepID=A0A2H0KC82_9BACT|nr:MAG: ribosomal RNA small subunit methyltransferase A [Candidatus Taylorbacteria bacterium CG11_big_fil_rev_8_21_14_0_20_46_11]